MWDKDCIQFLQWVLPQLHMRWAGFRKVCAQVCKHLHRRLMQLDIENLDQYRRYLEAHTDEWRTLDELTRVTISRFYRDKLMFTFLEQAVIPVLAQQAIARNDHYLKVWSVGCGAGEEPYTISLIWRLRLQEQFPGLRLQIVASDADPHMLQRANDASYPYGSVKNLPETWREQAFIHQGDEYCFKEEYQHDTEFIMQDVREAMPSEIFDLVLCRNLVFTYYDEELQGKLMERMKSILRPEGALVIGIHENLPEETTGLKVWSERFRIFRKIN